MHVVDHPDIVITNRQKHKNEGFTQNQGPDWYDLVIHKTDRMSLKKGIKLALQFYAEPFPANYIKSQQAYLIVFLSSWTHRVLK